MRGNMNWTTYFLPTLHKANKPHRLDAVNLLQRAGCVRYIPSQGLLLLPYGEQFIKNILCHYRTFLKHEGYQKIQTIQKGCTKSLSAYLAPFMKAEIKSYKQLPQAFYEWNTAVHFQAICYEQTPIDSIQLDRFFNHLSIPAFMIKGNDGHAHWYIDLSDNKERLLYCKECLHYYDPAIVAIPNRDGCKNGIGGMFKKVYTPDRHTIEEVASTLKVRKKKIVKSLIYLADNKPVMILIRGDHELSEYKFRQLLNVQELTLAPEETVKKITGAEVGFAGPVNLKDVAIYADHNISRMSGFVTGANETGYHLTNVNTSDFAVKEYSDLRTAQKDDACPHCRKKLKQRAVLELASCSLLRSKEIFCHSPNGDKQAAWEAFHELKPLETLIAFANHFQDENGMKIPIQWSPFHILLTVIQPCNQTIIQRALKIKEKLETSGLSVLLDDRDLSPGVKFKDGDLIGIPWRITLGPRNIDQDELELFERSSGKKQQILLSDILDLMKKELLNEKNYHI